MAGTMAGVGGPERVAYVGGKWGGGPHYSGTVYVLGDDRFKKLVPGSRSDEALTWTNYRKSVFEEYKRTQAADGSWSHDSWTARMVGPVYVTACYLTILQLDKAALPIYQR